MQRNLTVTLCLMMWWNLLAQAATAGDPVDWAALTVPDDPPLQYKGDATFYGKDGDKDGACGYGPSKGNSMNLPWASGTTLTVAMNDFQFAGSLSCGMCVKFRGVGMGIGTQPVPQQWQYAVVTNRCPECAPGSLDLATEGNGRWLMQWVPIPCNVGQSTFFYHAVSNLSNPYYYAFSVSNTRVPVKNVELEEDGTWSSLRRDVSNSWNANGGTYNHPLHIRLTSVLDDIVEDWIPTNKGGQGTAQFAELTPDPAGAAAGALPLTPDYPAITSADAGPVAVHWHAPNGTWMKTTSSNPASPGAPTRRPSSGSAPAEASADADSSSASASSITAGSAAMSPPPPPQSSSRSSSSASGSASSKGSLADWQQCGGTYRCSSNCADAAYTDKQCASGVCVRYDSSWWQCKPKGQGYSATSAPSQAEGTSSDSESSGSQGSSSASSSSNSGSSSGSSGSSSSNSGSSSSSSGGGSASASAGNGGSLAVGGNIGASASASSSGASASAGRKMLFTQDKKTKL